MVDQDIQVAAGIPPVPVNHYCPSEIVDIFSDFLSRAGLGSKVVFVTGVYLKTARQQTKSNRGRHPPGNVVN